MPKVYIIILNWNNWKDTIECLESVFRLKYSNFAVLVCDNNSTDRSLDQIAAWARGELTSNCENPVLQCFSSPPIHKPIPFRRIETGNNICLAEHNERLFLIQTGANLGFAGGNNIGLRLALASNDFDYIWLLNNDTVADPNAIFSLVNKMEQRPDVGICGSTLLYYHAPYMIQALGGSTYNRWTARVGHIGLGMDIKDILPCKQVEQRIAYVIGASMLIRKRFLEEVGLMDESYFLYFEEIDWAIRAKGRFKYTYSQASIVYHKEGGSAGSFRSPAYQSPLAEFYSTRSRALFTRRYFPFALPSVMCAILASAMQRLLRGRWGNFAALLKGAAEGIRASD
jgi:GT2 family glycosyltransferase